MRITHTLRELRTRLRARHGRAPITSRGCLAFSSSSQFNTTTILRGLLSARGLDHQEPLAIRGDVVATSGAPVVKYRAVEHFRRGAGTEGRGHLNRDARHGAGAVEIEQLRAAPAPTAGGVPPLVEIGQCPASTSGNGRTEISNRPDSFDSYASQRPSGESSPLASLNAVCSSGSVCRDGVLGGAVGSRRRTRKSLPVVGTGSRTISRVPSGRSTSGNWTVRTRGQPLDGPRVLAACLKRLRAPARPDEKRSRRPSGIHTGNQSRAGAIGQPRQRLTL